MSFDKNGLLVNFIMFFIILNEADFVLVLPFCNLAPRKFNKFEQCNDMMIIG